MGIAGFTGQLTTAAAAREHCYVAFIQTIGIATAYLLVHHPLGQGCGVLLLRPAPQGGQHIRHLGPLGLIPGAAAGMEQYQSTHVFLCD
jgi:hypothetical protein